MVKSAWGYALLSSFFMYRDAAFVEKLHQPEKIVDSVLLEPLGAGKNNRSLRRLDLAR
jgi:hypothetical protein